MKNLYLLLVLFCGLANAQTTIIEENFENDYRPIVYIPLPNSNELVIAKGKNAGMTTNRIINSMYRYKADGTSQIIFEDQKLLSPRYSPNENTFRITNYSNLSTGKEYKFITDGKSTKFFEFDNDTDISSFGGISWFNDKYEIGFVNQDGNDKIDFKEDDLVLDRLDIITGERIKIKFIKPDVSRLTGDSFYELPRKNAYFRTNIIDNDFFEIITKSLSKDYTTSKIYKTLYNFKGEKLNEVSFEISFEDSIHLLSNNGGGEIDPFGGANNNRPVFKDVLSVNNFIEDKKNGDIYFYGILGERSKRDKYTDEPSGYYIIKFDKDGKKVWESTQKIDDKKDFNDGQKLARLSNSLITYNGNLIFAVGTDTFKEFFHYSKINKDTGEISSFDKITFDVKKQVTFSGKLTKFLYSFYSLKEFKKLTFDGNSLIAMKLNSNIYDYFKNLNSKKKLAFHSVIVENGIWILETDNDDYYKVLFFEN